MSPEERLSLETLLKGDENLERLNARVGRFNLFESVGLTTQEIRHSNFLAFLLDPAQTHGLGDSFLRAFVQVSCPGAIPDDTDLSTAVVRREWQHLDLLLFHEASGFVCAIENKTRTEEHSDQLRHYWDALEGTFGHLGTPYCLFLTPDGSSAKHPAWKPVSYRVVRDAIRATLSLPTAGTDPAVLLALEHYLTLLETHVIDDPELDKLCDDIMRAHGPALRLLFERVETPRKVVANAAKAWIADHAQQVDLNQNQNKYISFVPKSWEAFSPLVKPEGDQKRPALCVLIENHEEYIRVAIELYGVSEDKRKWFHAVAKENPKAFPGQSGGHGKKFSTLYSVRHLGHADYATGDLQALSEKVRKILGEYLTNVLPRQTEAFQKGPKAQMDP